MHMLARLFISADAHSSSSTRSAPIASAEAASEADVALVSSGKTLLSFTIAVTKRAVSCAASPPKRHRPFCSLSLILDGKQIVTARIVASIAGPTSPERSALRSDTASDDATTARGSTRLTQLRLASDASTDTS